MRLSPVWDNVRRRLLRQRPHGNASSHGRGSTNNGGFYNHFHRNNRTTAIDVARFGLLSLVTLPFAAWIAQFTHDYVYRVDKCRAALLRNDLLEESDSGKCFGRKRELAEARALLQKPPSQIIVVAGANEGGKSRFVKELLQQDSQVENVTFIQLALLVDSVSSLTHAFVDGFGLKWLQMRYMLVDVLPFAGSEILVMKERFSDRDFDQALRVITLALQKIKAKSPAGSPLPVIVVDGLGEGHADWMRSGESELVLQRFLKWCVYVTKEHQLAHVVLTGNEQLVLSLSQDTRTTRGHVKVVGLRQLEPEEATKFVAHELPNATPEEIKKLTGTFGGWIHDLRGACSDVKAQMDLAQNTERSRVLDEVIKARLQQQIERVITAFAKGGEESDAGENEETTEDDDMDPFLDPLKSTYSEQTHQKERAESSMKKKATGASWTQLQLWHCLQRIVKSNKMAVPFAELRDDVFDGDSAPLLDLMNDDVLGFDVSPSTDGTTAWYVTPATPALGRAFQQLLANGAVRERFQEMELQEETKTRLKEIEQERLRLWRERKVLESRKASLLGTVELGKQLGRDGAARQRLLPIFDSIVSDEVTNEREDTELRKRIETLHGKIDVASESDTVTQTESTKAPVIQRETTTSSSSSTIQGQLKAAVLKILAREDPSLTSLKHIDLSLLEAAFRAFDVSGRGALNAEDVAHAIASVTGDKVDIEKAQSLVRAWDDDDSGLLDYEEFVRMLGMESNQGKMSKEK